MVASAVAHLITTNPEPPAPGLCPPAEPALAPPPLPVFTVPSEP